MSELSTINQSTEDYEIVQRVRNLFDTAKSERKQRVSVWQRNYKLVHNKAWSPFRADWLPTPAVSETYPIVASMVAWMTDQRTSLTVIPAQDPHSLTYNFHSELARDLEVTLKANWFANKHDRAMENVMWDVLTYGTGFLKVGWDAAKAGGIGDAVMSRVDPFRFYPDPQASCMDDANYFIEARTMSLQELERRWPGSVSKLNGEYEDEAMEEREDLYRSASGKTPMANPGGVGGVSTQWGRPGQGRNPGSKSMTDDQGVSVFEAWIRENEHYTNDDGDIYVDDSWRVIVVAGNHVVMNEAAKDIWSHAKHPYCRLVFNELGEFWGISLVEHLAPLQFSINRLLAAIQSNAELIGNPIMVEDNRSGVQRTKVVNKPGQRITKSAGSEFGWLDPPEMPNYISDLVRFYIGEMERVSGLSAIVRGATPTGRNAQGVLDSVQEAAFVRVRNALRNVEYTLGEAGNLISSLVVENYTQPRMVAVVGDSGAKSSLALSARHFTVATEQGAVPMQYQLWVQAGSSLPISRQARAQEADTLFAMGALDLQAILEAHDYPNRDDIVKRINAMQAAGMMQQPSARSAAGRTT